ncbi:MAG: NYN domain-containing protein [Anaerolineae bacterium]|nr:MAG: NYN domain-containing protein [Anaerolineae bacterium]
MYYLVDGHNLIASLTTISLDDPNDEAKLIIQLRRWTAAGRSRRISVFFDGGLPGGQNFNLSSANVSVFFASAGITADDLIISRIRKIKNSKEYVLVSSDREVKKAAAMKKMRTISSQAFAIQLDQLDRPHSSKVDLGEVKKVNASLNEDEVAQWLKIFKGEDENRD